MARKRKQTEPKVEEQEPMIAVEETAVDAKAQLETGEVDASIDNDSAAQVSDSGLDTSLSEPDNVVQDSAVAAVSGQHVTVTDSAVASIAAGSVEATDTLILVGTVGKLSGNAKVLVDSRGAAVFAAIVGLMLALIVGLLHKGSDDAE